jgi:hypothetical protein
MKLTQFPKYATVRGLFAFDTLLCIWRQELRTLAEVTAPSARIKALPLRYISAKLLPRKLTEYLRCD